MTVSLLPNNALDTENLRRRTIEVLNQLIKEVRYVEGAWTPVVAGSATAGTYEVATNKSRYTRIGRRVFLDVYVTLAGAITGGGTGDVRISGLPFTRADETYPIGAVLLAGVDWTAGASLSLSFVTAAAEDDELMIQQTLDNATNTQVAVSGLVAGDSIIGSICYETDDP